MNRDYPLFKLTIHPTPDDFAMRAVQHSANGWNLDSWQVLWPEGGRPAVAVMWKKNRNRAEEAAKQGLSLDHYKSLYGDRMDISIEGDADAQAE